MPRTESTLTRQLTASKTNLSLVAPKPKPEFYEINTAKLPARYKDAALLATQVCGSSLANDGILDGQICIVAVGHEVAPGGLAHINTPSGVMVKYVYYGPGGSVRLQSADRDGDYPDRVFLKGEFEIVGPVIRTENPKTHAWPKT